MMSLPIAATVTFFSKREPYIIAEVGQNHQGSVDCAFDYVKRFAFEGADAVKFQVRDNKYLFSSEAYEKPYESENAFAPTYGAHREHLELTHEEVIRVKKCCDDNSVDFIATPFDEPSLDFLVRIGSAALKVASFDLGNLPFLHLFSKSGLPVVISCGGGNNEQIDASIDVLSNSSAEIAVLHCVSEYPCKFDRLGLQRVKELAEKYPSLVIGSSDHFNGTLSGPVARLLGAKVFEKHVTLNRSWQGTDHSFALEPDGFRRFARDIRRVNDMLPAKPNDDLGSEAVFKKLGKSLIVNRDMHVGETIKVSDLSGKIFTENYVPVRESLNFIGKTLSTPLLKGSWITYDSVK